MFRATPWVLGNTRLTVTESKRERWGSTGGSGVGAWAGNGPFEAATANMSTRSFIGSPEWPFTHRNTGSRASTNSISGCQRSTLATGSFLAFLQPLAFHRTHHLSRKQFTT